MKSLYDLLMRFDQDDRINKIKDELDHAERIYAQNVAEYVYKYYEFDYEWDIMKDFPNLAPPFEAFWIEYRDPDIMLINGKIMTIQEVAKEMGHSLDEEFNAGINLRGYLFVSQRDKAQDYEWVMKITEYGGFDHGRKALPTISWSLEITKEGKINKEPIILERMQISDMLPKPKESILSAYDRTMFFGLIPGLLTICFMHCKNVQMIPRRPKIGNKLPRKRNGPKYEFHVLEIEPMKKILREEGKAEETGLIQALHICRGHFKDYSKGPGLFGKYRDVFWWDSQVRGSLEKGIVFKDYNVNEPKGTTEDGR